MRNRFIRILLSLVLIASISCSFVLTGSADTSDDIKAELEKLQQKSDKLRQQTEELRNQFASNRDQLFTASMKKALLDQEIELLHQEIENEQQMLHRYNLLIAEKQNELDALYQKREQLFEAFCQRIRAMQENETTGYVSLLLQANSFSDLLSRSVMVEEVAKADRKLIEELREMANTVLDAKSSLAAEKTAIQIKHAELAEKQEELSAKRAEADALLTELDQNRSLLNSLINNNIEQENKLTEQLAQLEKDYNDAKNIEENFFVSEQGFIFPVDVSGFSYVSSRYGYRTDPITGARGSFHNGIDLAAYYGTPIYAAKTGEVTRVVDSYLYGKYVIVNHGDGYSTYYGHMTRYVVEVGQVVKQGEIIGYVGMTGVYATGYHLHFGVFYNGSTVDPADYIQIPN